MRYRRLGHALEDLMADRGHSTREVAELSGVGEETLKKIIEGGRVRLRYTTLAGLDRYADVGPRATQRILDGHRWGYLNLPAAEEACTIIHALPPRQLGAAVGILRVIRYPQDDPHPDEDVD